MNDFGLGALFLDRAVALQARRASTKELVVNHDDLSPWDAFTKISALRTGGRALLEAWKKSNQREAGFATAWAPPSPNRPKVMLKPKRDDVLSLYDGGFTVALHGLETWIDELAPLCRILERDLGIPVGSILVEAFCSKSDSGTVPHYDHTTTINLQLEGEKTWWFGDEMERFPIEGSPIDDKVCLASDETARTMIARPGTAVFLPAGLAHATRTESASLALLFTIEQRTHADRLARFVKRRFMKIESLRRPVLHQRRRSQRTERLAAARALERLATALEDGRVKLQPHDGEDDRSYRLRDSLAVARISGRDVTFVSTQTGASRTIAMQSVDAHVIAHLAASKDKTVSLRSLAIGLAAVLVSDLRAALKRLTRAGLLV